MDELELERARLTGELKGLRHWLDDPSVPLLLPDLYDESSRRAGIISERLNTIRVRLFTGEE